uniref:Putative secreted protein n=1 Tax=Rhipicephalus microplus TaxID=6941 RepID=A0A6M2DBX2_RHIMP
MSSQGTFVASRVLSLCPLVQAFIYPATKAILNCCSVPFIQSYMHCIVATQPFSIKLSKCSQYREMFY